MNLFQGTRSMKKEIRHIASSALRVILCMLIALPTELLAQDGEYSTLSEELVSSSYDERRILWEIAI